MSHANRFIYNIANGLNRNALLLHAVSVANGYTIVICRIIINSDTERSPISVLTTVTTTIESFSSITQLNSNFKSSNILRANSGRPSFLVNGKIAAFTGANTGGKAKTTSCHCLLLFLLVSVTHG